MALTEWADIAELLLAVFAGIVTLVVLAVYLEQGLADRTAPPELTIVPPVREVDDPDEGVA
jgi:hypothetical protein